MMNVLTNKAGRVKMLLCVLMSLTLVFGFGMVVSKGSVIIAVAMTISSLLFPPTTVYVLVTAAVLHHLLFHGRKRI